MGNQFVSNLPHLRARRAKTSLAVGTAQRLGVTFEELEQLLENRGNNRSEEIDELTAGDHGEQE